MYNIGQSDKRVYHFYRDARGSEILRAILVLRSMLMLVHVVM
jgi:hypothetical protein